MSGKNMLDGLMASLQSGQDERVEMQKKMVVSELTEKQKSWLREESSFVRTKVGKRIDLVALAEKHNDHLRRLSTKAIKGDKDAEETFYAASEAFEGLLNSKEPVLISAVALLYTNMFKEFSNDMNVAMQWFNWGAARGDEFALSLVNK